MKLVRFDVGKTGLMVQLASGPHIVDVIGSLGALAPDDPISQGILNGLLKDKESWASLIEHWGHARLGLRRLASLALTDSGRSHLIICRADEVGLAQPSRKPGAIIAIDIAESDDFAKDPTGREVIERQLGAPSPADAPATSIIPFRDKIRSVEVSRSLQGS